ADPGRIIGRAAAGKNHRHAQRPFRAGAVPPRGVLSGRRNRGGWPGRRGSSPLRVGLCYSRPATAPLTGLPGLFFPRLALAVLGPALLLSRGDARARGRAKYALGMPGGLGSPGGTRRRGFASELRL